MKNDIILRESLGENMQIEFTNSTSGSWEYMPIWTYWTDYYYPVIRETYPVYMQEKTKDNSKQAYEIIKILKDKKLVKLNTVEQFIDLMDELIKIL